MHWSKVVETGRKVVESGVEKALMAANTLEQAGRRAAHSYNCLAEKAPIPLPKLPFAESCADEVPAPTPETESTAAPATAPTTAGVVTTESLLEKAAARRVTAEPAEAAAAAVEVAPAAKPRRLPTYNTMTKKMKKSEVQGLCRSLGIELTGEETTARLAELVLAHGAA